MSEAKAQIDALSHRAGAFAATSGEAIVGAIEAAAMPLLHWFEFLNAQRTGTDSDCLLDGAISSVREVAGLSGLGLVRPALYSMRMTIDLVLAWLYFKDHPVEWRKVNATGDGYKMKRDLLEYFGEHYFGFKKRWAILANSATRTTADPYRLLSAHIHAQSTVVLPVVTHLADIVKDQALGQESAKLLGEVSEFLSDILVCLFADKWTSLPAAITKAATARIDKKDSSEFFKGL